MPPEPHGEARSGPLQSRAEERASQGQERPVLRELSLYTGLAGFTLGLKLAGIPTRTVLYVEKEPYCQKIIKARIKDGYLDSAPIWDDVCTFRGEQFRGLVDIITAGFPCQPHSVAGQRRGALDKRNLWPDTLRIINEVGPGIVLLENVPGILANEYAGTVVGELATAGYDCAWGLLSASSVGAPHVRTRWWCLAYPNRYRARERYYGYTLEDFLGAIPEGRNQQDKENEGTDAVNGSNAEMAYPQSQPRYYGITGESTGTLGETPFGGLGCYPPSPDDREGWDFYRQNFPELEPAIRGMANGIPHRVDRLKALGNAVVPAVVAEFLRRVGRPR